MKILIFYQYFSTPKGAWGTRIYEFSKHWVEKGHQVTVVTSVYSKSDIEAKKFIETQNIDGIKVKVLNIKIDNKQPKIKRIFTFLLYSIISSWYAITLKSDIVIASSGPITVGLPGLISKYIGRKKFVYEVRDLWPEVAIELGVIKNKLIKKIAYFFEKLLYKNASLVVGLSKGMKDYIIENFNHKNVISITNSANLKLFSTTKDFIENTKINENDFYGIYTGNIGEVNNSMWLVNTARILKKRKREDIKILLIGDGQQKEAICNIIEEERLTNLIHFDLMPKYKLVAFIQHAKVSFVPLKATPVLDTSSPNKLFESIAAATPVIQTTNGWIKEYLQENKIGFTLDANSPSSLADLLVNLSEKENNLKEMRERAMECAKRDFDQKKLADKYLLALQKIK